MIEIVDTEGSPDTIVEMGRMRPLQAGYVVDDSHGYSGTFVMRSASNGSFEVMDLSNPKSNKCWTSRNELKIRLLNKGESVVIKLTGE